jgi:hypothetical protein
VAISKKDIVKDNIFVSCPTCFYEIPVLNTMSLPREFFVLCPNCGGRKLYQMAQTHDRRQDTAATRNSGRAQFGMKSATVGDLTAVEPTQPKSLLNQFGSWLLQ